MARVIKIIVEQHTDGFVAYPVGLRGVIVGQGDSRSTAIEDVTSAIQFHIETFGLSQIEPVDEILDVSVADASVAV